MKQTKKFRMCLVVALFATAAFAESSLAQQKLPADWTLETSFGADDRCQSFTGLWNRVNEALFAGGDFRVHRVALGNQSLVVAIRGKWSFTDEEAIAQIQKILEVEREFWRAIAKGLLADLLNAAKAPA